MISTVYDCKYKNKNYIVKVEYVIKDDTVNKNSQKQKEVEFSLHLFTFQMPIFI
jgi:hypothetical protein